MAGPRGSPPAISPPPPRPQSITVKDGEAQGTFPEVLNFPQVGPPPSIPAVPKHCPNVSQSSPQGNSFTSSTLPASSPSHRSSFPQLCSEPSVVSSQLRSLAPLLTPPPHPQAPCGLLLPHLLTPPTSPWLVPSSQQPPPQPRSLHSHFVRSASSSSASFALSPLLPGSRGRASRAPRGEGAGPPHLEAAEQRGSGP